MAGASTRRLGDLQPIHREGMNPITEAKLRRMSDDELMRTATNPHNGPGALRFPWTEERDEDVYAQIHDKAESYGLSDKLEGWEKHALGQIDDARRNHATSRPGS